MRMAGTKYGSTTETIHDLSSTGAKRSEKTCFFHQEQQVSKKPLNIGLVGYGFMGRTHSNAVSPGTAVFLICRTRRC